MHMYSLITCNRTQDTPKFESSEKMCNDKNRIRICQLNPKPAEIVRHYFGRHGNSRRWSQLFPILDKSICSLREFEFEKNPKRYVAALLQDRPSYVRRSIRLFWQFEVLWDTPPYLIMVCHCKSRFSRLPIGFSTSWVALHRCLSGETYIFTSLYDLQSSFVWHIREEGSKSQDGWVHIPVK